MGNEVDENFAVAGGLKDGPVVFQFGPQFGRVGKVAVVRQRKLHAAAHAHHQGLGVAPFGLAGGGIADVADGDVAGQMLQGLFGEYVGHQAHADVDMSLAPVRRVPGCDARALLSPVLQRVQAEIRQPRGVLMPGDAKNSTHNDSL